MIFYLLSCHKDEVKNTPSNNNELIIRIKGNALYTGNEEPTNALGNNGDFYLNLNSGVFYTGKTSFGWTNSVTLKVSNSAQTTTSILNIGKGIPSESVGKTGDFYIDTSNYVLYGPKDTASWNTNLLALTTDSATENNYVLTYGFDNIHLNKSAREFGTKYFYSFLSISNFIFNQDDSIRRAKYKYFNYARINYSYLGFNQILARAMNVSVRQEDLVSDPNIKLAKVGQPFQFIADSLHNSFTFTGEDSLRMVSKEYPDSILWRPLDPTMKVGEKMRFGVITSKADSINIYDNEYSAGSSVALANLISKYITLKSTYQLYLFIKVLPQYKTDSLSNTWVGGRWTNTSSNIEVAGKINDSTSFYTYTYIVGDSLKISSTLYAHRNGGPNVPPTIPDFSLPYLPSDTTFVNTNGGGRTQGYNADEYRNGTFYQIRVVMVPPGHSVNLSSIRSQGIFSAKTK
ncbi:hypothetical protein A9P82_06990 [Arachidicoccus ginsenosidimutans]|nr:hypothetical protein A9P82_06990 [Arachidicoccus sp. BS20]